jgi:hypothetical protein
MSNNIIGYFLANSGCDKNIDVLVEIEIPPDANTDINRDDIFDKLNAEYETNKYIVKKIYDQHLNEYSIFFHNYYSGAIKLGELVFVNNSEYDSDTDEEEKVKKFYMSKHIAIGLTDIMNGNCTLYHKNGRKHIEYTRKNGKKNGKYYEWLENGQIYDESCYLDDLLDGECKFYDLNGKLEEHNLYHKDKIIEKLDFEIFKKCIDNYVDDIIDKEKKLYLIDFNSKFISSNLISNNKKPVKKSKPKKKYEIVSDSSESEYEKPMPRKKIGTKDIKIENNFDEYYRTCLDNIKVIIDEPVKKEEFVKYKNEKLIDIIKGFFEKINTTYGKSYLEINIKKKDYIKDNIKCYIKYFMKTDNKDILMCLLQLKNCIFI